MIQGLNNVAQETRENGYYGGNGKGYLPDDANVVRGGTATPDGIKMGPHPEGVYGFSVQSAPNKSIENLASTLPVYYPKIGVTKVGSFRAVGGDVIKTSGGGQHATVTGVSGEAATKILTPPVSNPVAKPAKKK